MDQVQIDMSFSFQDSVRSVLQRNKQNRKLSQDVSSTEFSTKSMAESTASWPPVNIKRRSRGMGIVNALGGCFVPSKSKFEDSDYSFEDVSGNIFISSAI